MLIRPYHTGDCPAIAQLFYETVHTVNARDYTPQQLDAWADGSIDLAAWDCSFLAHYTLVAEEDGAVIGFGDMDETGYLDRLYVHKGHQGRGIATALCSRLEQAVGAQRFTTHASITAKPFFLGRDYRVVKEQVVERRGVLLKNFVMVKDAPASI